MMRLSKYGQFCIVSYTKCYAEFTDPKINIDSLTNHVRTNTVQLICTYMKSFTFIKGTAIVGPFLVDCNVSI